MYQRTHFYQPGDAQGPRRAQALAVTTFKGVGLSCLKSILQTDSVFLGCTVLLSQRGDAQAFASVLAGAKNVWGWSVRSGQIVHAQDTSVDAVLVEKAHGSPVRAVLELLGEGDGLPAGAQA